MTGRSPDIRSILRRLIHPVMVLVVLWAVTGPSIALATAGSDTAAPAHLAQSVDIPVRNPNPAVRVEDPNGLLTAQQFQVLNADLDRLARLGSETEVFFRSSDDESTSRAWLADDLRLAWGVESSVGARDGLVLVVSIDRENPANSTIVTSSGLHTFPIRELDETGFESLVQNVAVPQIQAGNAYGGVRDLLNLTLGTVIDQSGLLNERQLATLDNDLRRLGGLGLPTLVYVQSATDQEDDQALANSLHNQWAVEAGNDPSNAMVLVVTVDQDDAENSTFAYTASEQSFPIRQLTTEGYEAILADEALPALQSGDVYLGLAYAIRRTINFAEYSPPEPAPLNDLQEMFREPLNIVAAVLVQIAVLLYFLIPAIVDRRLTLTPSPRAMTIYIVGIVTLAGLVGVLGVLDHNRMATLAGLGVVVLATGVLPLFRAGLLELRRWLESRRGEPDVTTGNEEVTRVN